MRSIDEIVAVNVQMRMDDLKMSQRKLSLLTGLTAAYINKLLTGKSRSQNLSH